MRKISMKKVMVSMAVGTLMMAVPVITQAKTAAPTISVQTEYGETVLTWSTSLTSTQYLEVEASTDPTFASNSNAYTFTAYEDGDDSDGKINLEYYGVAGKTYYLHAYVYDYNETSYSERKSDYSNIVTYTAKVGDASVSLYDVSKKKVVLHMSASGADGYEIYRAIGKKGYQKIAVVSDPVYTDGGLYADTDYSYKVVPYASENGAKVYGEAAYASIGTYGAAMNVKATAASSNKVKVTWKKVPGASGYEVYRIANESNDSSYTYEKGYTNKDFSNMKLVATKKKKAKSYTDKKVKTGYYTYYVISYKMKNGKKIYGASSSDSVSLKPTTIYATDTIYNANGTVTMNWKKATGIQGYLIEKYNSTSGKWENAGLLGATATSYTFAAKADSNDSGQYRISSYTSTNRYTVYTNEGESVIYTSNAKPADNTKAKAKVTGIKAVSTGTGIQVTWDAVAGADYYTVYRSRYATNYDEDYTAYPAYYGTAVRVATAENKYGDTEIKTTSVVDQTIQVTESNGSIYTAFRGPKTGVTYYYYVMAHVKGATDEESYTTSYCGNLAKATLSATQAGAKVKKFTAKAGKKGQVVVKIKKAKGAKRFYVYASNKKKGTYQVVASSTKKTIKVKGLEAGKTYIKVATVTENESGADVVSKLSKAKAVKVK